MVRYASLKDYSSTLRLLEIIFSTNLEAYTTANIKAAGKMKAFSGRFIDEMSLMVASSLEGNHIMDINAKTPSPDMTK